MKKLFAIALALMLCVSALSIAAFAAPDGVDSLAVVGDGIPGVPKWDPAAVEGDMEEVENNVYVKELTLTAGQTMNFKVAGNDMWDNSCNFGSATIVLGEAAEMVCDGGSGNMTFTAEADMTIKITVDLNAFAEGGAATILVEEVVEGGDVTPPPATGDMGLAAVSVALLAATAGLVVTVSKKKEN